jgi:tetratricopeptide (TPR) repeat protein
MRKLLIAALLLCSTALAQHEGHCAPNIGWVPSEILQRPVSLRDGVGKLTDPVTTSSAEAQAFYNQGLAYIHNYVWIEAARSFHQALRDDSKLAMAHWGLARTYLNMDALPQANDALKKAEALAAKASPREQKRIEAMAKHLESLADPQNKEKFQAYRDFLDQALAQFPEDAELWIIRGNASEPGPWGRGQRGAAQSIAFYEAALNRVPGHWGANHYLIHSFEMIGKIDQALAHGKIYADAAFNIPHAHHMFGHDLRRNGKTDDAIARFLRAKELEEAYYKTEKIEASYDWHRNHNLNLLATSYQYQGRMKEAEQLLLESASLPVHYSYQELNKKDLFEFLLHRGRYEEALKHARDLANTGKYPVGRAAGHVLAGQALLALGRQDDAKRELAAAKGEISGDQYFQPYIDALEGEIMLRGKNSKADELLKSVVARVRAVPGPDAWMQAIYRVELLARAARESNNWKLAEFLAQQMLEHDRHYAGTHYALALVAEHKGDKKSANEHFARAAAAWKKADPGLTEIAEIQRRGVQASAEPPSTTPNSLNAAPTPFLGAAPMG